MERQDSEHGGLSFWFFKNIFLHLAELYSQFSVATSVVDEGADVCLLKNVFKIWYVYEHVFSLVAKGW